MDSFKQKFKVFSNTINLALDNYLPPANAYPPLIHKAMRYSVTGGGKRLRPVLVLAATETVGGRIDDVLPAACAIELIHTYSLVHDDLPAMDDDDFRRGKPTSHKVFGEAIAILAGDALLTYAFKLLTECINCCPQNILKSISEISEGAGTFGLIGGQVADTFSSSGDIDAETLDYIHSRKTGALYRVSLRTGAILAGARDMELSALTSYADQFGLAFQIIDDILDIEGDERSLGKPLRSDIRNNKATYPSLFGLEKSRQKARSAIDQAKEALHIFGDRSGFLRHLADFVIYRDN